MIRFVCVRCAKVYRAKDDAGGGKFTCRNCGQVLRVPLAPSSHQREAVAQLLEPPGLPPEPTAPQTGDWHLQPPPADALPDWLLAPTAAPAAEESDPLPPSRATGWWLLALSGPLLLVASLVLLVSGALRGPRSTPPAHPAGPAAQAAKAPDSAKPTGRPEPPPPEQPRAVKPVDGGKNKAEEEWARLERALIELRARERAIRIGRMAPVERMEAQRALEFVRRAGIENVPRETREWARKLDPDYIRGLEVESGRRYLKSMSPPR
jgi:hypothetical protein